jgi:polysaccharide export outer membrane protein
MAGAASLAGCEASSGSELDVGLAPKGQKAGFTTASTKAEPGSKAVRLPDSANAFTSVTTPGNTAYKIGPLDVLDISVFKVPDLSKVVQVADIGTVNLPLVGQIRAVGKTAEEVERDLEAKLGAKYLQSPQVTVYVKEYNSQRVTIEGSVKKPGVYPIRGKTSLLQSIAMAEGLDAASDSTVIVFRHINGQRSAAKFDVSQIRAGRAEDPALQQGDVIVVNYSEMKAVFHNVLKVLPVTNAFVPLL